MHDDIYQMYLEEIGGLSACTPKEEQELLARIRGGEESARARLLEGTLGFITELARGYQDRGLPLLDLVQEANLALMMAVNEAAVGMELEAGGGAAAGMMPEGTDSAAAGMAPDPAEGAQALTPFRALVKAQVIQALEAALEEQKVSEQVGEELLARVNVLQEVSRRMAEELGREATVAELAEKMKMTEDEIKDIMKLTLDAMRVSPDAEV